MQYDRACVLRAGLRARVGARRRVVVRLRTERALQPERRKGSTMKIETVAVYRVKGDRKSYRTYSAAVNRLAWLMVFEKYGDQYEYFGSCWLGETGCMVHQPQPVFADKCDCSSTKFNVFATGDGEEMPGHYECPVHDRQDGYLRRLHDRLVRYILIKYPMPRLATVQQ